MRRSGEGKDGGVFGSQVYREAANPIIRSFDEALGREGYPRSAFVLRCIAQSLGAREDLFKSSSSLGPQRCQALGNLMKRFRNLK